MGYLISSICQIITMILGVSAGESYIVQRFMQLLGIIACISACCTLNVVYGVFVAVFSYYFHMLNGYIVLMFVLCSILLHFYLTL